MLAARLANTTRLPAQSKALDRAVFKVIMVDMDGINKAKESRIHSLILNAGLKQAGECVLPSEIRVPY